jgi:hypothetical protein
MPLLLYLLICVFDFNICVYYRRFISGFSNIAKPLTKLTEEKQTFQWTPEVEAAFQTLKGALCAAPILAYPQPGEKFIVDTDASNVGIGGDVVLYDRLTLD